MTATRYDYPAPAPVHEHDPYRDTCDNAYIDEHWAPSHAQDQILAVGDVVSYSVSPDAPRYVIAGWWSGGFLATEYVVLDGKRDDHMPCTRSMWRWTVR